MLIDIHCHINLYLTLDEVIKEAKRVGVEQIIGVGNITTPWVVKRLLEQ